MIPFKIYPPNCFHVCNTFFPFPSPGCAQRSACIAVGWWQQGRDVGKFKPQENNPCLWSHNRYSEGNILRGSHTVLLSFSLFSFYFLSLRSAPGIWKWPMVDKLRKTLLSGQMNGNRAKGLLRAGKCKGIPRRR